MAFGIDDALMLAMAFGPSLFGGALGRSDPNEKLRQQALALFNPKALQASTNQFYGQNVNSPAYSASQRGIIGTGQHLQNAVAASLASRGVAQSGIGAVMNPLAGSATGMGLSKLNASMWDMAGNQAQNSAQARAGILTGGPGPPNYTANLMAGGMNAIMPMLMEMMKQRRGLPNGDSYWSQNDPQQGWQSASQYRRPPTYYPPFKVG